MLNERTKGGDILSEIGSVARREPSVIGESFVNMLKEAHVILCNTLNNEERLRLKLDSLLGVEPPFDASPLKDAQPPSNWVDEMVMVQHDILAICAKIEAQMDRL